jgi:hypothetical protein
MQKINAKKLEVWLDKELAHYENKGRELSAIEEGQKEALEVVRDAFKQGEFDVQDKA